MFFSWLHQDVHKKQPFESPPEEAHRRKALCVHVAGLWMEVSIGVQLCPIPLPLLAHLA